MYPTMEIVSRPKAAFLRHVGIHLADGRIVHITPERGVHLSSAEEFAAGHDVTIDEVVPPQLHADVIGRIIAALQAADPYHPTSNNCEIFVRRMLGREPASPQLAAFLLIAFTIGLCAVARK